VSSLASGAERVPRPHTRTITVPWAGPNGWLTGGVALVILLATFVARGGVRLEPTTIVEILMMLGGAVLVAVACLRPGGGRLHGVPFLITFALLAVYTSLSIVWSLAPADSWLEANRVLAYLGVAAGAVALVRLLPGCWSGLLYGVLAGTLLICLWALLTKVFPASLAADEQLARLRAPFEYWNSVGLTAAMAVPPLLWLAARRTGYGVAAALAWPALGLVFVCLMLSYSRGSLIAVAIGLVVWFAAVPLRLRAVAALACSALGAVPIVLWAFAQDGLTVDRAPMSARVDAGHELGALLLLLVAVLALAGLFVGFRTSRRPPDARTRRIAGRGLLGALALVPVAVLIALAASPGGINGQTTEAWHKLTDPQARTPGNTPDRLRATSSVRAQYWNEALKVHQHSTVVGTGAGSYATTRLRYRTNGDLIVRHAHGYFVQTLSDLGWVGVGLTLLCGLVWVLTAARALGMRRRDRGLPFDAERVALWTMAAGVVIFGVHSAIDWTWFVPGNVLPMLLLAGWVAGRGPLRARLEAAEAPVVVVEEEPGTVVAEPRARWRRYTPRPVAGVLAALALATALVAAFAAYQPVRAENLGDTAIDQADKGSYEQAVATAEKAVEVNPLSTDPLFELAAIQQGRGQTPDAKAALLKATEVQPASAEAWRRLGQFRLDALSEPRTAMKDFQIAYYLDPQNPRSWEDLIVATRAVQADGG
jgi:cytochrome c-type biogenesis protein CcmH/NrfG